MYGFIYDYREICWFKPVVGLSVRPSTFPSAFLLVSQVDYIPTYLSILLSACLSHFFVHIVFHSTVSLSLRLSMRPSTFPSAFHLFSQAACYPSTFPSTFLLVSQAACISVYPAISLPAFSQTVCCPSARCLYCTVCIFSLKFYRS
jgi:hypothetical protein